MFRKCTVKIGDVFDGQQFLSIYGLSAEGDRVRIKVFGQRVQKLKESDVVMNGNVVYFSNLKVAKVYNLAYHKSVFNFELILTENSNTQLISSTSTAPSPITSFAYAKIGSFHSLECAMDGAFLEMGKGKFGVDAVDKFGVSAEVVVTSTTFKPADFGADHVIKVTGQAVMNDEVLTLQVKEELVVMVQEKIPDDFMAPDIDAIIPYKKAKQE